MSRSRKPGTYEETQRTETEDKFFNFPSAVLAVKVTGELKRQIAY